MPRIKIEDKTYDMPTFNLGELRLLKREFGVDDVEDISFGDPDTLTGVCYIVMRRQDPSVTVAQVEAVESIELLEDPEDAPDPTQAASGQDVDDDAATGSSPETTPAPSGDQSTPASTPTPSPAPTT